MSTNKHPIFTFVNSKSNALHSHEGMKQQLGTLYNILSNGFTEPEYKLNGKFINTSSASKLNHHFYGKLNHLGKPVVPLEEGVYDFLPSDDRPVMALDFVADGFKNFKVLFDNHMALDSSVASFCSARNFSEVNGYVTGVSEQKMQVKRGWRNALKLHKDHLDGEVRKVFLERFVYPNQDKVESINDFMELFLDFVRTYSSECLVTFTSFYLSRKTPIHSTGLAIDIMQADSNDMRTVINMVSDSGFDSLVDIYKKSGFRCSIHCPWTLVADLNSLPLRKHMRARGVETQEQMFEEYFISTHNIDELHLRQFILDCYMKFIGEFKYIAKTSYCADGTVKMVTSKRRSDIGTSGKDLQAQMDPSLQLRIYIEARSEEQRIPNNQATLDRVYGLSMSRNLQGPRNAILKRFEFANDMMLNLDTRFLDLKRESVPNYLIPASTSDNIEEEKTIEEIATSTQFQTGVGGSGIAPGGGSTGGSTGGSSGGY